MIDGKAVAAEVRERVAGDVAAFEAEHGRPPGLATVLVGDDPASAIYVGLKRKACEEVGIASFAQARCPRPSTEAELRRWSGSSPSDAVVNGILVQLPVPASSTATR